MMDESETTFYKAKSILDEATERYGNSVEILPERVESIQNFCDLIDRVNGPFWGKWCKIDVNDETKDVMIDFCCEEFSASQQHWELYQLIAGSNSFGVEIGNDDDLVLHFTLRGIWKMKE